LRVNPQSLRKSSLPRLKKRLTRLTSLNFARKNLAPPAAKKSDLASVVADWDTDD
jgi:hypothetical protein